jgi:hypothetical protein
MQIRKTWFAIESMPVEKLAWGVWRYATRGEMKN